MIIRNATHKLGFVAIDNKILLNQALSPEARLVYIGVRVCLEEDRPCDTAWLSENLGIGMPEVEAAAQELAKEKYVELEEES